LGEVDAEYNQDGFSFTRDNITFGTLTARLVHDAEQLWGDLYPAWQSYADECERLLAFLREHGELDRFWPRLCSRKQQRDEALNEIRVAYFLEVAGYPADQPNAPKIQSDIVTIEQRLFWDVTTEKIEHLYTSSANFCLELRSRVAGAPERPTQMPAHHPIHTVPEPKIDTAGLP
jgi:hypothetical protein